MAYRYYKKSTTDDYLDLSIFKLKEYGYLDCVYKSGGIAWTRGGRETGSISVTSNFIDGKKYIELSYTHKKTEDLKYKVYLDKTYPNYGGVRYWFICPNCGRRVGVIYGGRIFICRKCRDLAYPTQNMQQHDRFLEKKFKIFKKLKVKGNEIFDKPKNMHWKTYLRLRDKANYYEGRCYLYLDTFITKMKNRINK
ncbi:MAG: hypothetical protein PHI50_00145 [Alphaproteobacteria bacterium]|nr:hypothetical protein [Alphaproteobacteria bacterium]